MTGSPPPLLEAQGIVRVLGRGELQQRVLHGVSLRVERGEFVALTGSSGSGKSTLLYVLGALDQPDAGQVAYEGRVFTDMSDDERALFRGRHLGYVFQFHFLLGEFTVLENVALPMLRQGMGDREANEHAANALAMLGLADLHRRRPGQLSGGQQQRVAIARAIAHRPSLILADEPTGALDSKNASAVFAALRHLSRTLGTAIVMVTHDPELAESCDRRVLLADGLVVDDGTKKPVAAAVADGLPAVPAPPPARRAPPRMPPRDELAETGDYLAAMLHAAEEADAETVMIRRPDSVPMDLPKPTHPLGKDRTRRR